MSNSAARLMDHQKQDNDERIMELEGKYEALDRIQAIIEFDLQGNILTANSNFCTTLGYSLDEIQGKHHRIFCDSSVTNSIEYAQFWQKLNNGQSDSGVYKRHGKGGKEVWIQASYNPIVDAKGKPYKVVKFATDITEARMRNAEFENTLAAVSKSQAVIEFDLEGTIITANPNFLSTLGYELREIKGSHHRIFCEGHYTSSHEYKAFWDKLRSGQFHSGEYKRLTKSGQEIWIQASYNPILDLNGKPYKVVKFARDVTALRKMIISLEETSVKVASAAEQLKTGAIQMNETAIKTSQDSGVAAAASEQVSIGVQAVAASTEEMVASIREISRSTNQSAEMARSTLSNAQETNTTIMQLGTSGQEIGNVIKVISSIAQQTNLLALNATIEAARAGEAGKGFAVVANEVKELAKQTAKATEDITNRIGAIQKDSQVAVEAIGSISKSMEKLNSVSCAIAAAVEEQTATTNEVSRVIGDSKRGIESISSTIKSVSDGAVNNAKTCSETLEAAKVLAALAETLQALVKQAKK